MTQMFQEDIEYNNFPAAPIAVLAAIWAAIQIEHIYVKYWEIAIKLR